MPKYKRKGGRLKTLGLLLIAAAMAWAWLYAQVGEEGTLAERAVHDWWPAVRWWLLAAAVVAVLLVLRRSWWRRAPGVLLRRWERGAQRNDGLATWWDLWRYSGRWLLWRKARVLRPTLLGDARWWTVARTAFGSGWRELGFRIAKVGRFTWVYASHEHHRIWLGPTGVGKTIAGLSNVIVDAPGPVVVTSTKLDVVEQTREIREQVGPVHYFNPFGLGGPQYATTIGYNPVPGCLDLKTARATAGGLVAGSPAATEIGDAGFWKGRAVSLLALLLHAADLAGGTMLDVLRWWNNLDETLDEVLERLDRSPSRATVIDEYRGWVATNDRSRSSVTMSGGAGLEWMSDPALAKVALVPRDQQFNIAEFLRERGTLYLIAPDGDSGTGSLFTVIVSAIREQMRRLASQSAGLRLDPPLHLVLGEAPQICPVPLAAWIRDTRSSGGVLDVEVQDRSAIVEKWGEDAAGSIWTGAAVKIVFGGIDDGKTLQEITTISGHKTTWLPPSPEAARSSPTPVRVPAIGEDFVSRGLKEWQVLVITRSQRLTIGRVTPVVYRRDVHQRLRKARAAAAKRRAELATLGEQVDASMAEVKVPAQPGAPAAETVKPSPRPGAREGAGQ